MVWNENIINLLRSRAQLPRNSLQPKAEDEGGCGVIGSASSFKVEGKYFFQPLCRMRNRGNGKGGGIAAVGLSARQMGVSKEILENDYLIQIAFLDTRARKQVESKYIKANFTVHHAAKVPTHVGYKNLGLDIKPPEVYRYFCQVKKHQLENFSQRHKLHGLEKGAVEDEFVYQNSYKLNNEFYSSLGKQRAFVLSHGKNMFVLKLVGLGDQVFKYYQLDHIKAHIWIGHHRYPTKGHVWHPGGAHPFIGLNEALVHNGDFSNYYSVTEYLSQKNIHPLFLTDTEVAVQLFDLWMRVYNYPLEYVLEAMAPTTERDFAKLPEHKQKIFRQIQTVHMRSSPDGPWFFLVAKNNFKKGKYELIGVTDTSMLRPQVFALQEGKEQIGIIASERQAINGFLMALYRDGKLPASTADKYWNARGGSHKDGGAFVFSVGHRNSNLTCKDKFQKQVHTDQGQFHTEFRDDLDRKHVAKLAGKITAHAKRKDVNGLFDVLLPFLQDGNFSTVGKITKLLASLETEFAIEILTRIYNLPYSTGQKKRSSLLDRIEISLYGLFLKLPAVRAGSKDKYQLLQWKTRKKISPPQGQETVVIDATGFPIEGNDSLARCVSHCFSQGWRKVITFNLHGHRFIGCGIGQHQGRIDIYGDAGDYCGSGLDGVEVHLHNAGQDQVGQIIKTGKLVVYGDVGQTFMYGSKGGKAFVLGNAAGRPLINAVGNPKVVINGTCLDYLAESFMAGDPLKDGGFVIVNAVTMEKGEVVALPEPYPGSNLFSLASGGAIYIRDPHKKVEENQLNGGCFSEVGKKDWKVMLPLLRENEELFNISVIDLLTVDGEKKEFSQVYRKISPFVL